MFYNNKDIGFIISVSVAMLVLLLGISRININILYFAIIILIIVALFKLAHIADKNIQKNRKYKIRKGGYYVYNSDGTKRYFKRTDK